MATSRICLIPDCGKPVSGRGGWCLRHYKRWKRHGDPLAGRTARGELKRFLVEDVLPYEGDDCLAWPYSRSADGYGVMQYDGRSRPVARIVCQAAYGPPPTPSYQAAHSCGRGHLGCVTKRHLSWKTRAGNEADKVLHGTSNRGERSGSAKLSEADIEAIMALKGKLLQREIAEQFGIRQQQVSKIHLHQTWRWRQGEPDIA